MRRCIENTRKSALEIKAGTFISVWNFSRREPSLAFAAVREHARKARWKINGNLVGSSVIPTFLARMQPLFPRRPGGSRDFWQTRISSCLARRWNSSSESPHGSSSLQPCRVAVPGSRRWDAWLATASATFRAGSRHAASPAHRSARAPEMPEVEPLDLAVAVVPCLVRVEHLQETDIEWLGPMLGDLGCRAEPLGAFLASLMMQVIAGRWVILDPGARGAELALAAAPAWPIELLRLDLLLSPGMPPLGRSDAVGAPWRIERLRHALSRHAERHGLLFRETARTGLEASFPGYAFPRLEAEAGA